MLVSTAYSVGAWDLQHFRVIVKPSCPHPQISVPLGMQNGLPVSVSLLARHGADFFLLHLVQAFYQTVKERAAAIWESDL